MFICESCKTQSKLGEPSASKVLETREKTYPPRIYRAQSGKFKGKLVEDPGGIGMEIVREIRVCYRCA